MCVYIYIYIYIYIYVCVCVCFYFTVKKYNYEAKSKVLQYFGNMRHNSSTLDTFAKIKNDKPCWTVRWEAHLILSEFTSVSWCMASEPIVMVLATWVEFPDQLVYSTVILCTFTFHFQVIRRVKQCTTCQCTIYNDTSNHIRYFSWLQLF